MSNKETPVEPTTSAKRKVEFELPSLNIPLRKLITKAGNLVIVLLIIATLALGSLVLLDEYRSRDKSAKQSIYNKAEYQIVYLDNNLFYFCKLEDFNPEYVACNDSYYLVRKSETKEDGSKEDKVFVRRPSEEELSKPEGPIYLLKENIVYIAKIGTESSVLEFINGEKTEK